jgi:hypothetical protein
VRTLVDGMVDGRDFTAGCEGPALAAEIASGRVGGCEDMDTSYGGASGKPRDAAMAAAYCSSGKLICYLS